MRSLRPAGEDGGVSAELIRQARNGDERSGKLLAVSSAERNILMDLSRLNFALAELGSAEHGSNIPSLIANAMKTPTL
jgi:hypothetical protein